MPIDPYPHRGSHYYRPSFFGGFAYFPPVIKWLLLSNTGIWLFMLFFGRFSAGGYPISYVIYDLFALNPLSGGFKLLQLVTYLFIHGGFLHLFFNMFALWMFGMQLENDWGSRKFLTFYMTTGIGAGLSNLFIAPLFAPPVATIGASGAIYGVLIAFGMLYPDQPIYLYFLLPIKAKYFVAFYIMLELFSGVTGTSDGIAHFAHLGGALVGFIYILLDQKGYSLDEYLMRLKAWLESRRKPSLRVFHRNEEITDAKFEDVDESRQRRDKEKEKLQQRVDEILDKISKSGYASLTEEEKRILFEASKKLDT